MTMVDDHRVVDPTDPFPIGMRVLAVDDDPTCLVILKTLLQKCQYNVTTTDNAITALKLLRENKNKFDLVISDVHMPDMDGFKLLELVGLEMDLPVIMLSVNDDPRMMMKGITHGACFYLLKPVRVEDLKNIWQHVIRRKKVDSKEKNKTNNQDKPDSGSCNELVSPVTENSDQNAKPTKKRKDQDEDDDEDHEHGHDYEDPSSQKKPRVVWSPELHRKFISAIEQLGIDKAVPKKILDLMNVEKLTRENVASHLQKYRLYLRKMNNMANQQANMMATLGSADPSSYLRMSPLSGVGHFQALSGSGQFHNNGFRSFSPGGMISRLNSPAGLNVHGFPSSGTLQLAQAKNLNNSTNDHQLQYPSALVRGNQNLLSVGLDQFQHNKGVSSVQNLTTLIDGKPGFHPISNRLAEQRLKVTIGGSTSPIMGVSNNALMLEQNSQGSQGVGIYDNPTSLLSQHSELSVPLLDHGRCSDIWSSAVHSSGTNSYPSSECFRQGAISPADNLNSSTFQGANLSGASSITSLSSQSHDSLADMHSQGGIFTNNPRQISNNVPFQGWDDHNQNANYHSNVVGNNSINSLTPMDGLIDPTNSTNRNLEFDFCDPLQMKHDGIIDLTEETSLKHHQLYTMDQQKSQNSRISNNVGSLEDLVSEMMKQKQDMVKLSDGDFLCDDNYSGGTAT